MTRVRLTILCLSILLVFLVGSASADSRFYYVDGDDPDTNVYVDIALSLMGGSTFGYSDNGTFTEINTYNNLLYNNGDIINYALCDSSSGVVVIDLLAGDVTVTPKFPLTPGSDIYQEIKINWGSGYGKTTFAMDDSLSESDGMKAIPIPASVLLLGSGIVGLIALGRVRRNS